MSDIKERDAVLMAFTLGHGKIVSHRFVCRGCMPSMYCEATIVDPRCEYKSEPPHGCLYQSSDEDRIMTDWRQEDEDE